MRRGPFSNWVHPVISENSKVGLDFVGKKAVSLKGE